MPAKRWSGKRTGKQTSGIVQLFLAKGNPKRRSVKWKAVPVIGLFLVHGRLTAPARVCQRFEVELVNQI